MTRIADAPVIFSNMRAQTIDNDVLVDLTVRAKETANRPRTSMRRAGETLFASCSLLRTQP